MQDKIIIKGAREHNLKNINLEIPRNKMVVFTGVSGSGKSSLAFDTIFAEGQRRYIESLSAYARQFLGGMSKPDVDEIEGLSPAIAIDQKAHSANPRSTVATLTEIYDFLRVLFARIGTPHCPHDHAPLAKMTVDEMTEQIINKSKNLNQKSEIIILAPVVRGRKGEYYQMLYDFYNSGYLEVRVDGKFMSLKNKIILDRQKKHTLELVIDKLTPLSAREIKELPVSQKNFLTRLNEALEIAVDLANGLVTVVYPDDREQIMSTEYSCPKCSYSFPEIEPRLFSFNSPYGYCPSCAGLGTASLFSEKPCPVCQGQRLNNNALSVTINNKNIWDIVNMNVSESLKFFDNLKNNKLTANNLTIASNIINEINNRLTFMNNVGLHYLTLNRRAGTLSGGEAQRIRLASQVGQRLVGALYVLDEPTIGLHQRDNEKLIATLRNLTDAGNTIIIVEHDEDTILKSDWLVDIGPGAGVHGGHIVYSGPTEEMLFINKKNNPDPKLLNYKITKLPPIQGNAQSSLTGKYLRGELKIDLPSRRRQVGNTTPKLKILGATANNLKNINVEMPLGRFVCITGVSGSGKSTLMENIIFRSLSNKLNGTAYQTGRHRELKNSEYIDKIIDIDQSPIGRTPRSNPATYTKSFDHIRELFAATTEARVRGFGPGRFSFNRPGGRCEKCAGRGALQIEMHFLPSVEIVCDVCKGKRFAKETLDIHFQGKNIAQVLNFTIAEAEKFFRAIPFIYDKLKILNEVGLDYLTLGQSAVTLSGGEAQRIKLSRELARRGTTRTLYLLDEPTVGLHYDDVKKLITVLNRLVNQGNTVLVIEHNLDVIKSADWLIDLGPEGGEAGGELVFAGTPEQLAQTTFSHTGRYLRKIL